MFRFFAFCSVCRCKIGRQGQLFPPTPSLAIFSSTPSLAGTQQQQQHLRLHQQECGSAAAAAATARMRRVQQPTLHVSSSISCEYVISVSVLCALSYVCACVLVGACGSVCWDPTFQDMFFLLCLLLLLLLTATETATMRVWTTAMHVCVVMMYACMRRLCAPCTDSHGPTAIAQQVCADHFYAYVDIAYIRVCVMCVL